MDSIRKFYKTDVIYILSLIVMFMSMTLKNISQNIGFGLMACFILCACVLFLREDGRIREKKKSKIIFTFLKYNLIIKIIMHVYTIVLVLLNLTESRFLSTNFITYVNAMSACAMFYLLGERIWKDSILALIFSWIICILIQIATYGAQFVQYVEFNDLSYAAGYVFLYYVLFEKKWYYSTINRCLFAILIIIVAGKRIGIAGLILIVAFHYVFSMIKSENIRRKIITIISWSVIIGLYLFVYLVVSGVLFDFIEKMSDTPELFLMGRNYYWAALAEWCEFDVSFIGYGRNASATLFTTDYAYMRVGNVHSDILKVYMESGFILFGIWLINYMRSFVKGIERKFGYDAMYVFFIMNLYTFFVYITDNTDTYFITQYFYMMVPMMHCYRKEKKVM